MTDQALVATSDDMTYNPLALMPRTIAQAKEFADMMAKSDLIPDHLRGKSGNCLMITMQAYRWKMDPFVVANCTSVQHGRMMYEGKLVAAALTSMNAIEGRLKYEIKKLPDGDMEITVTGTPRGGEEQSLTGTVKGWRTFQHPKGNDGKPDRNRTIPNNWDKDPQSQLVYRGTRQWARLFAPEAILGVYAPEDDFDDAPVSVAAEISTAVPQKAPTTKPAAPIEEGEIVEPKKTPPAAKPQPAAPAQSQPSAPQPSSPPQQQQTPPAEQAPPPPQTQAQAASDTGDALPFSDPNEMEPGPNGPSDPRWNGQPPGGAVKESPSSTSPGDPLSETQMRIIKSRQQVVRVSDEEVAQKFPGGFKEGIGKGNINEVLAWLESKRQAT